MSSSFVRQGEASPGISLFPLILPFDAFFFVVGAFIVMFMVGITTGNLAGIATKKVINKTKDAKSQRLNTQKLVASNNGFVNGISLIPAIIPAKVKEIAKSYFIKLGINRIPIEESEVKDSKRRGYEVIFE